MTPYLTLDLGKVDAAYRALAAALPSARLHYAVKCQPHPGVLRTVAAAGGSFEIASAAELDQLAGIDVDPSPVLFSNPVKAPDHIARAHAAGVRHFAADSRCELDKLAQYAPGARVYARLAAPPQTGVIASEGKFGVDPDAAADLLREARRRGLEPYGLTFHVGSQTTDPQPWALAVKESAELMKALAGEGIRLSLLDIGGGFPARYADTEVDVAGIGARIEAALAALPHPVEVVAEPGRALVAEAGTFTATVVGVARRAGVDWLHLDLGAFNGMMESLETGNRLRYPMTDSVRADATWRYHVTGPTCDSQDTIQYDVPLSADLGVGDRVYVHSAGAYSTVYASTFNGFAAPDVRAVAGPR